MPLFNKHTSDFLLNKIHWQIEKGDRYASKQQHHYKTYL